MHPLLSLSHDIPQFLAQEPELDVLLRPSSSLPSEILLRINGETPMLWPMDHQHCAAFNMNVIEYLFHEAWNITLVPYGLHQDPQRWASEALHSIQSRGVVEFGALNQRRGPYVITSRYVPFVHALGHHLSGKQGAGAHATFHVKRES